MQLQQRNVSKEQGYSYARHNGYWTQTLVLLVAFLTVSSPCLGESQAADFFSEQVAPILQKRCYNCHNDGQKKGGFSLQTASSALADGYIVPGDADASHLIDLLTPTGGAARMPKDAEPLTPEELSLIRKWVSNGAKWPKGFEIEEPAVTDFDWWAFNELARPKVPLSDSEWRRTPIDAFILRRLESEGLTPSAEVDKRTLIRRVTFDLIGLPPTPEQVEAFLADSDPNAYEKLVDRLLASKHYGERWARHWLDVVKYADSCGYDKDKPRDNAWPYRDYVIRSFNQDKPYGRFIQEQVAGDVLFPGQADGVLGLGFLAAGPWDFIGHVEVPESKVDGMVARNLDRDDMVSNVINSFCSVTIQCARCHNHKFDPFTQEHYYGLQAVFAAVDRAERPYDLSPGTARRINELQAAIKQYQRKLGDLQSEIKKAGGDHLSQLGEQIARLRSQLTVAKPAEYGYHSRVWRSAEAEKWVEVEFDSPVSLASIVLRPCHDEFKGIGGGFGFPRRFKVQAFSRGQWQTIADHTSEDFPNPGVAPVDFDAKGVTATRVRVTATKLTPRSDDFIFALAELQVFDTKGDNIALGAKVKALDTTEHLARWGVRNLTDGKWPEADDAELALQLKRAEEQRAGLLYKIETPERVARRHRLEQALHEAEQELSSLPEGRLVYAAATDFQPNGQFKPTRGNPRPVFVLKRGNVQTPGEQASPGAMPLSNDVDGSWRCDATTNEGHRRAELAAWLTSPDHPLVWRSIVNRVWQYHFGDGIVATPNDFGRMGQQPTHPELLDWLAVEFRDGGQSFKKLHRMIVTSSAYRQSVRHDPSSEAKDGGNRFLWRMNRRRLEAEEVRDAILRVSGALNTEMGGPGFYLFHLEKAEHSPHYEYHKFDHTDPKSYRRSIYRFVVRSQPNPWMRTMDCADSSQSTPKRDETLTSLQALALLNNRFNLVMAERFADRLREERDSLPAQADRAMELVAQRSPTPEERQQLSGYAQQHGLENLCRMLFNLNEFVFVD